MDRARTVRDLGALVARHRREQGLTQAALAERAGVSREWLGRLERGSMRLEIGRVLMVLGALGLALSAVPLPAEPESDLDDFLTSLLGGERHD